MFSKHAQDSFKKGLKPSEEFFQLPCGKCIGCRLERSRQWAVRIMHEAQMYDNNIFITLTYDDENLPKDGSLHKEHFQLFMKRLRSKYVPKVPEGFSEEEKEAWLLKYGIRFYHCGEYGELLSRPHYHACIFNFDFPSYRVVDGVEERDKEFFKTSNGERLFTSKSLSELWGYGFCLIGELSFESAAYVARYCTKVVNGDDAEKHYSGKQPEYSTMSRRPGIGCTWYEKYKDDAYPSDYLVLNGSRMKPPRYYDVRFGSDFPDDFEKIRLKRIDRALDHSDDNSCRRLNDREYCKKAQFKRLYRPLEV